MDILGWFWRQDGWSFQHEFVTFDESDTWSVRVLAGKVSQAGGHILVEQRPQEQHLPVCVVPSLWSGSLVLQREVHGTGSSIRYTFMTVRDKKHYSEAKRLEENSIPSALRLESSEKTQSAPHEETRECWNRAGIRPGTLPVHQYQPSYWRQEPPSGFPPEFGGVGRPGIRSTYSNSSCLLTFSEKKWSELQNILREYKHLFFIWETNIYCELKSICLSIMGFFCPLCG